MSARGTNTGCDEASPPTVLAVYSKAIVTAATSTMVTADTREVVLMTILSSIDV